ncbi:MAG TPA: alpha/beta fold hydrolase [Anaeromyxobacter sp.]|nr:alpha/beta fold hydrolase [Anaeromyxobacter sp.]
MDVRISPSGRWLALVKLESGRRALEIVDLAARKVLEEFKPEGVTGVGEAWWVSDDRLVLELVDHDGDLAQPKFRGELCTLRVGGGPCQMSFGYRAGERQTGTHIRKRESERAWARVLGRLRRDARKVVIATQDWDEVGDRLDAIYRLDVVTGLTDFDIRGPLVGSYFVTDEDGNPRVACAHPEPDRLRCYVREPGKGWEELTTGGEPVAFASAGRTVYLVASEGKGFGVFEYSIDSGVRRLLARNDLVPPSGLVLDSAHRLVAVEFTPDLPIWEFPEPQHPLALALRGLEASFPGERVRFVDCTDDDSRMVVEVYSDRDPGRFLVVDVKSMTAVPVGERRPWVNPEEMAEVSAFHIRASDGHPVHGFVLLPREPAAQPPPMVVVPHGGPFTVRDRWRFDSQGQLLASEGFAVLKVNFRGSGGYGEPFQAAGYGHWGDRIMEDIADAVRFAVRQGWADPQRIAIFGGSFGGYAALQSTIVAPELYRCAVGYAGVYELEGWMDREETVTSRLVRRFYRTAVNAAPEDLRRASPVYHADQILVPVLLIHGEEDKRAPFAQAKQMREALIAQGRPPEWLVEPREGHGFYDEGARQRMAERVVKFLKENTMPREGAPAPDRSP